MAEYKETLRRLALNDETFVAAVLGMGRDTVEDSTLDEKTHALARLSASLAIDAASSSYQSNVELALAAGATVDEIVGCLIAVAPIIGLARAVSAAPELALALGYDVDCSARDTRRVRGVTPIHAPRTTASPRTVTVAASQLDGDAPGPMARQWRGRCAIASCRA